MRSAVVKDKSKDKNIVVCRLKKTGKRFELSLNKDAIPEKAELRAKDAAKVINWNLVLSAPFIFLNAAKQEPATPQDLITAFPKSAEEDDVAKPEKEIYVEILVKGEMLLTDEQRVEKGQKVQDQFAAVAAGIVEKTHVRPSEDEDAGGKKKKKTKEGGEIKRLGIFPVEEIERELKNAKFKPVSTDLQDQVVEGIAVLAHNINIVRTQSAITVQGDGAPDMKAVHAKFETTKEGYILACPLSGDKSNNFKVVFDPSQKEEVANLAKSLKCKVEGHVAAFLPTTPEEDLTFVKPEAALSTKEKAGKKTKREKKADDDSKSSKKGSSKRGDDSDDEGMMQANSLEAQLAALKAEDSDDGGKKGKKGGKKGKGGGGAQPPPKKQAQTQKKPHYQPSDEDDEEEESDDEPQMVIPTMKPKKRR